MTVDILKKIVDIPVLVLWGDADQVCSSVRFVHVLESREDLKPSEEH